MAPHCSAVKAPSRAAPAEGMGAQRWSRAIAKGPPRKIRIVHVEEPKVIKTDARQFRELVQRLTGKPSGGRGRGVGGGNGASSSSSSAEIAASESSSSSQASGGSSSSDRAVAAPASAVKVEEEDAASPARAFGEVGCMNDGVASTTAAVKAEVEDAAWTPEEEEVFAAGFGQVGDTYDAFFHGLDDFLLSAFQEDGCFRL